MSFQPTNPIEQQLLDAQEGRLDSRELMAALLPAQLFMPIEEKYQIAGLQSSEKAQPLLLQDEQGNETVVLFTSPERAKSFLTDFPAYRGGLLTEFSWLLERIGSGVAITINPDAEVGLDLAPEMIEQLRH